jgi:hypothetical protein
MRFIFAAMLNNSATTVKPTANSWVATSVHLITPNLAIAKNKMLMFLAGALTATFIIATLIWIALGENRPT